MGHLKKFKGYTCFSLTRSECSLMEMSATHIKRDIVTSERRR